MTPLLHLKGKSMEDDWSDGGSDSQDQDVIPSLSQLVDLVAAAGHHITNDPIPIIDISNVNNPLDESGTLFFCVNLLERNPIDYLDDLGTEHSLVAEEIIITSPMQEPQDNVSLPAPPSPREGIESFGDPGQEPKRNNITADVIEGVCAYDGSLGDPNYEPEKGATTDDDDSDAQGDKTIVSRSRKRSNEEFNSSGGGGEKSVKVMRKEAVQARIRGESFTGFRHKDKKSSNIVIQDVPRESRFLKPTCNSIRCQKSGSRFKCHSVTEEQRKRIFDAFWRMESWAEKQMFITSLVTQKAPQRRSSAEKLKNPAKQRDVTYTYHLKVDMTLIPVCQSMFLNTFDLKNSTIRHWLKAHGKKTGAEFSSSQPESAVGEHKPGGESSDIIPLPSTSTSDPPASKYGSSLSERKKHLNAFLDKLPKMESHYCRKNTSRLYLRCDITSMRWLYNKLYVLDCKENNIQPINLTTFNKELKTRKISLFSPRKDQCDVCFMYKHKNVDDEEYQKHRQLKNRAREGKDQAKKLAEDGKIHAFFCCDAMAIKLLPQIEASASYYKMKLTIHNYTVYNYSNRDAMNFWFTEADGNVVASSFASMLIHEIEATLENNLKEVVVISDGCGYQNRNAFLSNALLNLSMRKGVVINHKYLEKGHTQMDVDTVHSTIETYMKRKEIYLPHEWVVGTKEAREAPFPYRAQLLSYEFFKDFSRKEDMRDNSIRPGNKKDDPYVLEIRWLRYEPEGKMFYKLDFDGPFHEMPRRPKNVFPKEFPPLLKGPLQIPKDKFDDLQSMKKYMPKDCHPY